MRYVNRYLYIRHFFTFSFKRGFPGRDSREEKNEKKNTEFNPQRRLITAEMETFVQYVHI